VEDEGGGFGGGGVETMLVMEALGRHLVLEPYLATVVLAGGCVAMGAAEWQKKILLPKIIDGSLILAFAHAEPNVRFDLAHVGTRATRDGNNFVLEGEKTLVLHGSVADKFIVSGRTAGGPGDARGVTLFIVEADEENLGGQEYPLFDGTRALDLQLSGVKVGPESVIGTLDQAMPLIDAVLDRAMAALCAEAVGIMDALHATTVEYLKTRQQFGQPIGRFQAIHLERLTPLPGREAMLRALAERDVFLGVVSNKTGELLRREVAQLGWSPFFGSIVGAGDASADKPARDAVHLALSPSGVPAGGDVWFVGDTAIDMECALNSGCIAVLLGDFSGFAESLRDLRGVGRRVFAPLVHAELGGVDAVETENHTLRVRVHDLLAVSPGVLGWLGEHGFRCTHIASQRADLEAQLKQAQDKLQQAQKNADLASSQRAGLEAQLKKAEENLQLAQQAQQNADLASSQRSDLEAELKQAQDKLQQVQQNADRASSQRVALEARLTSKFPGLHILVKLDELMQRDAKQTSVGASGGILGLCGYLFVLAARQPHVAPAWIRNWMIAAFGGTAALGLLGFFFIDNAAHIGGALTGLACGAMMIPAEGQPTPPGRERLLDTLGWVAAAILLGGAAFTVRRLISG
jgi:phosphoglycolate phosphatase-like HAD superfamily hydrolase